MNEGMSHLVSGAAALGGTSCMLLAVAAMLRHRGARTTGTSPSFLLAGANLLLGIAALTFVFGVDTQTVSATVQRAGGVCVLLAAGATATAVAHLAPDRRPGYALAAAAALLALLTPVVPGYGIGQPPTALWVAYQVLSLATMLAAFVGGAVVALRSATSAPGLARAHSRLLAAGLATYAVTLGLGSFVYGTSTDPSEPLQLLFWFLLIPVAVALSPPAPVRVALRRGAAGMRQASHARLFRARTREQALSTLLPTIGQSLGATALALVDDDGAIEWCHGLTQAERRRLTSGMPPRQALSDRAVLPTVLPLRAGQLVVVAHPLTPHNGVIEAEHLDAVALELDLALLAAERLTALGGERAARLRLESEQDQLDADNAALRAYGRAIAHDIKTPLTVIRGAAETIGKLEQLSPQAQDLLDRIVHHSDRAAHLVDDQLDAASDATDADRVQLADLCLWLQDMVADELADAGSTLAWPDDLPEVEGNRGLLERVLLNLVRNALQHATSDGPIAIWIHTSPQGDVLVTDDGTGMVPEDAQRIFEPGVRLDSRGAGGLGLADSRAALRRVGGDLRVVDTRLGLGTTMAIVLPTSAGSPGSGGGSAAGRAATRHFVDDAPRARGGVSHEHHHDGHQSVGSRSHHLRQPQEGSGPEL